ncbi:hypothetical protein FEM48_Zijuj02G0204400 [Ziziphus jujuba var. spinosa]|uniref:VOC domain-containing protein n=1 Tax=Ziziphus jujuba var. spinosa TaxID=714518 RepID=A0A978VXT7_ZIZJJ|nr:hypothetical protein FEM48_Zijuj02G0204400 [Ziziphus jujuba var. spinosa]
MVGGGDKKTSKLPLVSLNHVSFACNSVTESVRFYEDAVQLWYWDSFAGVCWKQPSNKRKDKSKGQPHSFQCSDIKLVTQKLEEMKIQYVTAVVEEGGIQVDQLFFHDPDGYMVEICNCHISLLFQFPPAIETQSQTKTGRFECNAQAKLLLQH